MSSGVDSVIVDTSKLWTKKAWHEAKGQSRSTIDRHIREKKLKAIKINGSTLLME